MNDANFFKNIPDQIPEELIEPLIQSENITIERIISKGHASPPNFWYDQQTNEWVILLKGRAKLVYKDNEKIIDLKPGDYVHIPAHCRHRVEWTDDAEPTIWLAVHYTS